MGRVIRRATGEDISALSPIIADALTTGRLGAWLVPDPAERPGILDRYAQFVLGHGLAHGQRNTTDECSAITVWYPQLEPSPPSAALMYDLHNLLGSHAARFALLHAYADAVHPHTPHPDTRALVVVSGLRPDTDQWTWVVGHRPQCDYATADAHPPCLQLRVRTTALAVYGAPE